jgi:hypothetical protein
LEVEEVMAAAAASSLEELAEDLERIAAASSTEDSSLDETDIDMLVDADLDKVLFTHSSWCFYAVFFAVLWIRIRRIRMFLVLLDPHPDPLVTSTDPAPDPSIIKQNSKKTLISTVLCDFFMTFYHCSGSASRSGSVGRQK